MRRSLAAIALAALASACTPPPEPILLPPTPQAAASATASAPLPAADPLAEKPAVTPAAVFVPPVPEVFDGPAGSKIWLLERHTLPLVSLAVVTPLGAAAEPGDRGGLAVVTADMLDEGAGTRDALAFSAALDELGAHLSTAADRDKSLVACDVLSERFEPALALVADAIVRPRHDAKDFGRVSALWKNALRSRGDDPQDVARLVSSAALFGVDHPYGRPLEGTTASAGRVGLPDVARFHHMVWRPDMVTFVVVGDTTRAKIGAQLEKAFAGWTAPKEPKPELPAPKPPEPGPRVVVVEREGAPQVVMTVIKPGVAASSPELPGLGLLNVALGGSFTSRLNQNLREDHGWTYGARTRFAGHRTAGSFVARAAIRADAIEPALKETLKEIDALAKSGLDDGENGKVRALVRAEAIETYGSIGAIARSLAQNAALGLPPDQDARELAAQASVKPADLTALSAKYLPTASATIVLVGPRKAIEAALSANGLPQGETRDVEGKPTTSRKAKTK